MEFLIFFHPMAALPVLLLVGATTFQQQGPAVLAGLLGSLVTGFQIGLNLYGDSRRALWAFLPWGVLAIVLLAAALWIMLQPMEMRGTVFAKIQ